MVPVRIIELNTESPPEPRYRDETDRVWCKKCGRRFLYSVGMFAHPIDADIRMITDKHLELCEGNTEKTLVKIHDWWERTHGLK